jgi:hypothetical protein
MSLRLCRTIPSHLALILALPAFVSGGIAGSALSYTHGDPTPEEQLMLELVNRARMDPTAEAERFGIDLNEGLSPDEISSVPKPPLALNPSLIQGARGHSAWMLSTDVFAHEGANGSSPGDRMSAAGYTFSGSWTWGENIAFKGTTASTIAVSPAVIELHQNLFVDTGISGRGHRLNLLNADFREIGIGVETGIFTQNGKDYTAVMATQDFAASGANPGPFLVGVVYQDTNADGSYTAGEGLRGVTITPAPGSFHAVSSSSGGYAIPITGLSGAIQVAFAGGPLIGTVVKSVALTGENVKLDFELNADSGPNLGFVPGSLRYSEAAGFQADLRGPVGARLSIQASDNLVTWSEVSQVTLTSAESHFTDKTGGPVHRYYRALSL